MVKDHTGRHLGVRHTRIIKRLKQRRRRLKAQQKTRKVKQIATVPASDDCKNWTLDRPALMFETSIETTTSKHVSETVRIIVSDEILDVKSKNIPESDETSIDKSKPIHSYHIVSDLSFVVPEPMTTSVPANVGEFMTSPSTSKTTCALKNESHRDDYDTLIPVICTSKDEIQKGNNNHLQKSNESTDQYLHGLFTPSVDSFTMSLSDTSSKLVPHRCNNCHRLFSNSDSMSKICNLFSSENEMTQKDINTISDHSYGLSNLFAEIEPVVGVDSTTSLGLRTLFDQTNSVVSETSSTSFPSFNSLYPLINSEVSDSSSSSTYGIKSVFSPAQKSEITSSSATSSIPLMTKLPINVESNKTSNLFLNTTSSSVLGNILKNETSADEVPYISEKEQQKTLIIRDLTQHIGSDDEVNSLKSQSIVTFINQLESIFKHYETALNIIKKLEAEIAILKAEK